MARLHEQKINPSDLFDCDTIRGALPARAWEAVSAGPTREVDLSRLAQLCARVSYTPAPPLDEEDTTDLNAEELEEALRQDRQPPEPREPDHQEPTWSEPEPLDPHNTTEAIDALDAEPTSAQIARAILWGLLSGAAVLCGCLHWAT